jgi:GNAT superfamily N-acetyltransferase
VDQSVSGQGLGGRLLRDCFVRCLQLADQIGIHAVTVDAIDEQAAKFYEHFGFTRFLNQNDKLFIPLDTIRQAVGI